MTLASGGAFRYVSGSFSANGPFQAATGSIVDVAGGSLAIGDPLAVNGVYIGGTLVVHDNTVTLEDANDTVFDSGAVVTLGDGAGSAGTLAATNGLTLDFGGNMMGFGTVDTPDVPTTPLINNGHITGNSLAEPITLTGYVKGVGTCDNCNITGTDAPGSVPQLSTEAV